MVKRNEVILKKLKERLVPSQTRTWMDDLTRQQLETLVRLIEADSVAIHYSVLCRDVTSGRWSTPARAATIVSQIRSRLGRDSILTLVNSGYVIGVLPDLDSIEDFP